MLTKRDVRNPLDWFLSDNTFNRIGLGRIAPDKSFVHLSITQISISMMIARSIPRPTPLLFRIATITPVADMECSSVQVSVWKSNSLQSSTAIRIPVKSRVKTRMLSVLSYVPICLIDRYNATMQPMVRNHDCMPE